jgi:hypothetical protein
MKDVLGILKILDLDYALREDNLLLPQMSMRILPGK